MLERGVGDPLVLAESDRCDSVLCARVADVDFDGQNEVLLGTYGQVNSLMVSTEDKNDFRMGKM